MVTILMHGDTKSRDSQSHIFTLLPVKFRYLLEHGHSSGRGSALASLARSVHLRECGRTPSTGSLRLDQFDKVDRKLRFSRTRTSAAQAVALSPTPFKLLCALSPDPPPWRVAVEARAARRSLGSPLRHWARLLRLLCRRHMSCQRLRCPSVNRREGNGRARLQLPRSAPTGLCSPPDQLDARLRTPTFPRRIQYSDPRRPDHANGDSQNLAHLRPLQVKVAHTLS